MKKNLFGIIGIVIAAVSLIVFFFAPFGGLNAYLDYETMKNLPDQDGGFKTVYTSSKSADYVHYGGMVIAFICLLLMAFFIRKAFDGEAKPLRGVVICAVCFTLIPWIW